MGTNDEPFGGELSLAERGDANTYLARLAQDSFLDAIDLLFAFTLEQHGRQQQLPPEALPETAAYAAAYALSNPKPAWLDPGLTNEQFAVRLLEAVEQAAPAPGPAAPAFQAMGMHDVLAAVGKGITRLKDGAANWASRRTLDAVRGTLHGKIAVFIGDVFVYLEKRGRQPDHPGPIVDVVVKALKDGMVSRNRDDPLIVIGHSLGGVILYDIFTYFLELIPKLQIDTFITVGSQVGLFEEMKSFRASKDNISAKNGNKVPKPACVARWLNIFDETDVLSFAAGSIFEGVEDFSFSSQTHVFAAHSAYLLRPSFYERLRARLRV